MVAEQIGSVEPKAIRYGDG